MCPSLLDHYKGKSLGDRVRIQEDEFNGYFEMPEIVLPEELQGKYKKFNNSFYIFPDWRRKHKGTPFYLIADDKEYIKKTLDWGVHSIDIVEGFIVTQNSMVVLATVIKNNDVETLFPKTDLWMFHFNKFDGKIIFSKKIGDPTFIYSFPGTSNVIEKNQKVFFVWNKQAQMNHEEISLHLVQYDIASKSFSDTLLPYKSTWNISISIGATLRHICLAYHGISPEISVEFLPINTE